MKQIRLTLFEAAGGFAAKTVTCSPTGFHTRSPLFTYSFLYTEPSLPGFLRRSHCTSSLSAALLRTRDAAQRRRGQTGQHLLED